MKKKKIMKYFSSILAFIMVLALFTPFSAATNIQETKPFKPNGISESNMQLKAAIAEQLNLLGGSPQLHKDLQGLSGDEQVAVIVHLSERPVALEKGIKELAGKTFTATEAKQVKAKVTAQQSAIKKEMSVKNISYKQGFAFDTVLNGFAVTVKADDLDKLLDIKGVSLVEPDAIVQAFGEKVSATSTSSELEKKDELEAAMNTSISFLGIEKLWAEGLEGQGIKVAVLDTGIDKDHPEFEGIYKGGKNFIPNGTDYARDRTEDDASETSPLDRPAHKPIVNERGNTFHTDHGTHVAGTIAAIGANEYGIKGIAPKVDLYAYRVLGAYGSGSTSGIIKAIDTAVIEKMDVINLSLGGGANTETDAGSFAINNAMMAGTISVIATGNDGPNRGTMGTPGTARLGIAVGNTTNPETKYDGKVTIKVGDYDYSKQLNFMGTTFGQELATQLDGEYELVAVPGVGAVTDYEGIDVVGKVALISRGEIAFVDKIAAAKKNGAIATIIHNFSGGTNAPDASGTFLGDSFAFIPTLDMSVTDGAAIRDALASGTGTITFGNFGSVKTLGDEVNDSSSRGPSTPNFDIKPDVTAPGTNIMSSIPAYKADFSEATYEESYDRFTGTSMATPHIAGIAALIKQANPDWNAFDVKVALSNTAKVLNTKYDVFSQGAGRVDAYAAAHSSVLAYAEDTAVLDGSGEIVPNLKGTVTFGPQKLDTNISVTKQILVKDLKGTGGEYNVTVDVTKAFKDAKVTVDKPTFTLNGEQTINVTLTASKATGTKPGDEILGYIHINGADNEISLPFAADFAQAAAVQFNDYKITETDLSFDGDGVQDEAVLSFTVTGNLGYNYIEIWDIMDPEGGKYEDGYIGYLHAGTSLGAGSYTLAIKGQYRPWESPNTPKTIPDGLYTIDFNGEPISGNPAVVGDYVGPIVVKTTKPEIDGSVTGEKFKGQITDKYIEYNVELAYYDLEYDLNEKLHASYVIIQDGKKAAPVSFQLKQDGSFDLPLAGLNEKTDSVTVFVEDAAGNKAEKLIFGSEPVESEVTLTVDKSDLTIENGKTATVKVTETTKVGDETTDKDVTAEATYVVGDEEIATVEAGEVTAKSVGETTINITYGEKSVTVNVTVVDPTPSEDEVTLTVDKSDLTIENGKTAKVKVTETTKVGDGTTEKDVTAEATYVVGDEEIATVEAGEITAKSVGETTINITYGEKSVTVNVTVVDPNPSEDEVTLTVDKSDLTIETGKAATVKVIETTKVGDETTDKDVTKEAIYVVEDEEIASVEAGVITAKSVGETTIKITYGEKSVTVNVTVVDPTPSEGEVSLTVDKTDLTIENGKTAKVKVTETTKVGDETTEKDVTKEATYVVADEAIATVEAGVVTAKSVGKTTITIKHGENTATVNVTVVNPPVVTPDPPVVAPSPPSTSTPPAPPNTNPGQVDLDHSAVQKQLNDTSSDKVVVQMKAPSDGQPEVSLKVTKESLKALAGSTKPLVIKSGNTEVAIPNEVLKEMNRINSGSTTISVKMTQSKGINGAVSASFEFTIKLEENGKTKTISTFSEPIEVSIPVTGAVKDPRKTAAYYVNESKKSLDYVGGTLENNKFVFKTNHFSKFVVVENSKTFTDIQKHWAQDEIEVLASRAITSGATDATFNPEGKVTRAEFAVLIARALNLNVKEFEGIFKDVTKGNEWAYAGIEAASRAGIVTGKSKDTFDPNALITREEIATMIVRAVKYQDANLLKGLDTSKSFKDDKEISKFAKEFVKHAAALGIVNGRDANQFVPKANASRAEAAAMLYRSLEKLNEM